MAASLPPTFCCHHCFLTSGPAELLDILRKTFSAQFGRRLRWSQVGGCTPRAPHLDQLSWGDLSLTPLFSFIDQRGPLTYSVGSGIRACTHSSGLSLAFFKKILFLSTSVNLINCSQGTVCWQLRKCTGLCCLCSLQLCDFRQGPPLSEP